MTTFGQAHTDAEIEELCRLMLGLDRGRLLAALERLEDRGAFTEMQSRTLSDAMRLALQRDPGFAASMGEIISKGVHATVERDSAAFGQALAPAMGPAIRNSVRLMLQGFVNSIEAVVDQRLSWRSVKWRIEAWRTGRSFAEVAFRHTLLYRVEHVFLVHREDGVQLLHVSPQDVVTREPDLIAAMLTAIQDFVRDAFDAEAGDTLSGFAVGDLRVIVESGSHAVLAAVVRGKSPSTLRLQLREALDRIETSVGSQLQRFDGVVDGFEVVRPHLEECLVKSELPGRGAARKRTRWVPWALFGAAVLTLVWLSLGWIDDAATERRFAVFVDELEREPGIVITAVETTASGWRLRGLRDPLSVEIGPLAAAHQLGSRVEVDMQPYHALHPRFVAQRVEAALAPPPEVTVTMNGERLVLAGTAGHEWCRQAAAIARAYPGVGEVDVTALQDADELAWSAAASELAAASRPMADLLRGYGDDHRWLTEVARRLAAAGRILGRPTTLRCTVVLPAGDDAAAAAIREARKLAESVELPVEIGAAEADASVTERVMRFEAVYRRR